MAPGNIHRQYHDRLYIISILFGIAELILLYILNMNIYNLIIFMILYPIFYWIGNFIEPDLDLLSLSSSDGAMLRLRSINIFLGIVGLFFATLSLWYAWSINKHRSIFSHGFLIGTVIRIIWYNVPILIILNLVATFNGWHLSDYWYEFYCEYWVVGYLSSMFFALFFSDNVHLILDTNFAKGKLYMPISNSKNP